MEPQSTGNKRLTRPLLIAVAVLTAGLLFKLMHWPGGDLIMPLAFGAIAVLYAFRFNYKTTKRPADYVKYIFVICWSVNGIFTVLHLPGRLILQILAGLSFIALLIMGGINPGRGSRDKESVDGKSNEAFSFALRITAVVLILLGAGFKIMHWPGGSYMLIAGFGIFAAWFLKDSLSNRDQ